MEQSYKEKYEQALAKAKEQYNYPCMRSCMGILEEIFPELAESGDEKIRKEIVRFIQMEVEDEIVGNKWLAWLENIPVTIDHKKREGFHLGYKACLEKQGETSPILSNSSNIGKDEPKFKVGDWINGYYTSYKVLSVNNEGYVVEDTDGNKINILFENEKFHHLWTIQDAKDGDVLATEDNCICIFDNTVEEGKYPFAYCGLSMYGFKVCDRTLPFTHDNVYPATKEQRDLLFQKMNEAGYTFDFEKKELKKIEPKPEENKGNIGGISPNSAWSEEDDMILSVIVNDLKFIRDTLSHDDSYVVDVGSFEGQIEWLQSLKDRVQPQPKQGLREEEEAVLDALIRRFEGEDIYVSPHLAVECLKSLKERIGGKV